MATQTVTRTRFMAAGVLALVFGAGFILGLATDRQELAPQRVEQGAETEQERRDTRRERRQVIDEIALSVEQRTKIDSIVDHYRQQMAQLNRSTRGEYRAIVDSTREEIKRELTPEQAAQYDSLLSERYARGRTRARRDDNR